MSRLARSWLSPTGTVAATVLYVANPYQLVLTYYRSDFAELLAAAIFPLAVHYALRCAGYAGDGESDGESAAKNAIERWSNVVPLAVTYGAIWLTNAPAAVLASYALALLLALCAILRRSLGPLIVGLPALALGLMLAGVYIVPAAYEQAWVNIDQALSPGYRPAENFLFTWILNPEHNLVNLQISSVAVLIIALTGVGATISHYRAKSSRFIWIVMFALAATSVFLMFPVSGAAWRYAPKLRFAQFPWRWLLPLGVSLAFFLGEAVATSRHRLAAALCCALVFAGAAVGIARATYWDTDDLEDIVAAVTDGKGYEGTYEYCTAGGDQTDLPLGTPLIALFDGSGGLPLEDDQSAEAASPQKPASTDRVSVKAWQPERKTFEVDASGPGRAAVRLLNYPAWQVRVNGVPTDSESDPDTAQMIVPISAGKNRVEVRFARTLDRTAGGALSCVAALFLAGTAGSFWWRDRKEPN